MRMIQGRVGGSDVVQTALRLPADLRDELKAEADRIGRSLNTHIVMVLGEAAGGKLGGEAPAAGNEDAAFERGEI